MASDRQGKSASDRAEEIRLRYIYRKLAMTENGRRLSIDALKSLIGPDCAYHLYGRSGRTSKKQP
ncbi:MAG: hypothetical protein M0Z52_09760 [Actinomycetota bacterium]|nr:hypothetical protein [Actinomycetota bacterium]